jgi:polyphenol oxidase
VERRRLNGQTRAVVSTVLEREGFLAAFTERGGGVSEPPYQTLNLGLHVGDRDDAVVENRRRAVAALGVPPFAAAQQVHGAALARVSESRAGAGFEDHSEAFPEADALAVTRDRVPVAVLVADCLPIALASPTEGRLVAAHVGWRGLAAGIVRQAAGAFEDPRSALAALGPAIGPCHYEVGEEVALAVAAATGVGVVTQRRDGRLFLDLAGTAELVLREAGLPRIEQAKLCTACEPARFFSHRRDGRTGRQALVAMRL